MLPLTIVNGTLRVACANPYAIEASETLNWGHAAGSVGRDIAMRENVKRVVFMHRDPASSDEKIAAAEAEARRYYHSQVKSARRSGYPLHEIDWCFAVEGMEIDL